MKLKALIVESTDFYRELIGKILSDIGIVCDFHVTGKSAIESEHNYEYAFIVVSRHLEDMGGELFLHRYRENHHVGEALTIMISNENNSRVLLDATKAGYKLVFDKKDINSMQAFLKSVVNYRTLTLNGQILYLEEHKSAAAETINLFVNYKAEVNHVNNVLKMQNAFNQYSYDLIIVNDDLENAEVVDTVITYVREFNDTIKARIPILVLTSESDATKRTSYLRNGANDFILKPYYDNELIVRASNLIENKKIFEQSRQQQEELTKLAMTDQLTGLYNRHNLFDIGPKYLSNARRHNFPISLLVIDLDHFKSVNDSHGHSVGDLVLKAVAQTMKNACRNEDLIARFGGEEFVMLLSHCDIKQASLKAEYLRTKIEETHPVGLKVTASIGIALLMENDSFDILFNRADQAVYKAKETGRNKVVVNK